MGAKRTGRGTVNAVLNRLVAGGVTTAFRTSLGGPAPELGLHVICPEASFNQRPSDLTGIDVSAALVG
jgi:hypothetical protein